VKYTQEHPTELVKQLFEKLFVERIRGKRGGKLISKNLTTGARVYAIQPAQNSRTESEIPTLFNSTGRTTHDWEDCQAADDYYSYLDYLS